MAVRAVFGVPVYGHADQLRNTLDSLLNQSSDEFAVVAIDDASPDESAEILAEYAAHHENFSFEVNRHRVGYTENARRVCALARECYPEAAYFAWGSDHDVWHPDWLSETMAVLDADQGAVMAWTGYERIDKNDELVHVRENFSTDGVSDDPVTRFRAAVHAIPAGSSLHGLMRVTAIRQMSGLRFVIAPDRLMIMELAILGKVRFVPRVLWQRRYVGLASTDRQIRASFPGRVPLFVRLPVPIQHFLALLCHYVLCRKPNPQWRRSMGVGLLVTYVRERIDQNRNKRELTQEKLDRAERRQQKVRDKEERIRRKLQKQSVARKMRALMKRGDS